MEVTKVAWVLVSLFHIKMVLECV